jgi:UDP-N-acetyl-D-glucosamine dehydrogenase
MDFIARVKERSAVIGVIGLGYVGTPLALTVSQCGLRVVGFDVDPARIDQLNGGESPVRHIPTERIAELIEKGFEATADFSRVTDCDAIIICVPTPLNEYREPDLSFVVGTMESIAPHLRKGQLVSLESTTWPGTSREILLPYLERAGLTVGEDAYLVYSPEREDPGNARFDTKTIPKIVGGHTPTCLKAGEALYGAFIDRVVSVSSTEAAEMVKLLENIHRAVNIGLVNEMKVLTDRMGLNIFEIVDAAATKPFGFTPYYPGPGIGGHCIPIDPFYLTWKAREYGLHTRFIELAGEINASMPQYVVDKTIRALSDQGKSLKNARVLVLGIAYKPDVEDVRESPSVLVMELLRNWGADVHYSDPHVPVFPRMRQHTFDLSSTELTPDVLRTFDAVLLLTNHTSFDYGMIRSHTSLLIDTRGIYRGDDAVVSA